MENEIKINTAEIDQALKEFEQKEAKEVVPNEEIKLSNTSKMVERVMKWSGGVITNERQAEYVLLGFVVIALLISMFLFFGDGREKNQENIKQQEILYPGLIKL